VHVTKDIPLPSWPQEADVCVALTFDVDAHVGAEIFGYDGKLTTTSDLRYGITRGLPRILETLDRLSIRSTFYVPGEIADLCPDAVRAIAAGGHEVGHHGYLHRSPDLSDEEQQREEVERGVEALAKLLGEPPVAYRAPGWELTPQTFDLLLNSGFRSDSSCMGDDRPYYEQYSGRSILELPVHWSLDDWVYFSFSRDGGGAMSDPHGLYNAWLAEFRGAVRERRMVTYTMHPEAMGRGYRMDTFERLVEQMRSEARVWFARHADVVDLVTTAG
jgi:peptidoglycan/xylan/chitin deacetylase (PgdA/CDA1 family)